ncbi:MAG: diphthine synthase [Nanoarchaeota archaeon]
MLYLIGLGLNHKGISQQGLEIAKKSKKVYVESYTIKFPYDFDELEKILKKSFVIADREKVENLSLVDEARKKDVALLVYGSPLFATTHVTLINEAIKSGVKVKVIHSASIFDAISMTGLQLYKFGKTTSLPKWNEKKKFMPDSFVEVIKDNQKISAHTLLLVDIGLRFEDALNQLEVSFKNKKFKLKKILVCEKLGTKKQNIIYDSFKKLKEEEIKEPYCFIIPGEFNHYEEEFLKN